MWHVFRKTMEGNDVFTTQQWEFDTEDEADAFARREEAADCSGVWYSVEFVLQ